MKEAVKYGLILFTITAICVGILGAVNDITAPIIAANEAKTEQEEMKKLLPDGEQFEEATLSDETVEKVFVAKAKEETVGYVVRLSPNGYGGAIGLLVAMDGEQTVKGISILSHSETPGFGANAQKPSFTKQFEEKKAPLAVTKGEAGEGQIAAITGATITSTAVTNGVNTACDYVSKHKEEWGK